MKSEMNSYRSSPAPPYAAVAPTFWEHFTVADVAAWVRDARQRTLALIVDLSDEQLLGPKLATVNPLLWELGHLGWFQERWVLRHVAGAPPLRADADALYDSSAVPHDVRWDLPLYPRRSTLDYLREVHERVLQRLERQPSNEEVYFHLLAVFHEDMHGEAFLINRQTWGYPRPDLGIEAAPPRCAGVARDDVPFPGGTYLIGAAVDEPFVFDNEKWAHPVKLQPFAIARAPVTQAEFLAFVEDGGYRRREFWSAAGWAWRERVQAQHPIYWRKESSGAWLRRDFDRWLPLEPELPVINVCWYEAEAWCRWARRRLPTEAEWEVAASFTSGEASAGGRKRRFSWGEAAPAARANLDGFRLGCAPVTAYPEGDTPDGLRQMIGNVWEWTASDFVPFPGFVPDPYKDYSQPWFHTHKVLRGGCWATRARLIRNTWRNFYLPDRRDVWAGFRTCALDR